MAQETFSERRQRRVRFRLARKSRGRVRLSVFRSGRYIYAQIIDDKAQSTLASASTLEKELKVGLTSKLNCDAARVVGQKIAERALAKGIREVVFDRGAYLYHGRVKALAEGAREKGLSF